MGAWNAYAEVYGTNGMAAGAGGLATMPAEAVSEADSSTAGHSAELTDSAECAAVAPSAAAAEGTDQADPLTAPSEQSVVEAAHKTKEAPLTEATKPTVGFSWADF